MRNVLNHFAMAGAPASCTPYGNGHINRTWLVNTDASRRYILQKINTSIFPDVPALMRNIDLVTRYLRAQGAKDRETLRLIPTSAGEICLSVEDPDPELSGYYRMYAFVENSLCLERAESAADFEQSAVAFGRFQMQLRDFPASQLSETLPAFHHTRRRFEALKAAIAQDPLGRAAAVAREIDFALAREQDAGAMVDMLDRGELPLRVTHNDTKLNNVLLDAQTRQPLCVIDLDTVMPGLSGNDFGDSIRFGASTGAEDEQDLDRIEMSLPLFEAYARGFLHACGNALTPAEIHTLPLAARLMTYECGIRFLADYLLGDTYFRIHRPDQNLDRARTQFKLVWDMERKQDAMLKIIASCAPRAF